MTGVRIDRSGAVGTITLDRRERLNSLAVRAAEGFRRAALQFARDAATRVVVVRGLPGMFCTGADLESVSVSPSGEKQQIVDGILGTIADIRRAPKPFVAAVDGIAAGGGFAIAMSCDLVIASTRASFEWACGKTGLTGAESSTLFLPRLIGLRRALELMLLNPRLAAEQALEYGLITAVHDVDVFDAEVQAVAERLAEGPSHAFATAKELLNRSAGMDGLEEHFDRERQPQFQETTTHRA